MKKIIISLAIFFVLSASAGYSQTGGEGFFRKNLLGMNYSLSFPVSDFHDFIQDMGYRGWDVELKTFVTDNIAVGGGLGWYAFYQKYPRDTYEFENGALTTTVFAYHYSVPMRAVVDYYFLPNSFVHPWIGLNINLYYNDRELQVGYYLISDESWNFGLTPEVGILVPFGRNVDWGAHVKGKYNYQFYNRERFNNLSWFDVTFGLSYTF